jgi:hypothetical protein
MKTLKEADDPLAVYRSWMRPWRGYGRVRMDNRPEDRSPSLMAIKDDNQRAALSVLVEMVWLAKKYVPEYERTLEYIHAREVLYKSGVNPDEFFDES